MSQGAYLANAAGCEECHTDREHGGQPYAGGRALATPFGTFYSPNITPDPETGIGRWSDEQFLRALRDGVRPDGANYFPVFPYPSFTNITDADARAIKAYLFSLPAVRQADRAHDVSFPFSWRFLQNIWKLLFFTPGPFRPAPDRSEAYNRGAYLVTALAHCGECNTPRNWLGATEPDRRFANGMFSIYLDPKRIDPSHVFDADMTRYLDWFRDAKAIPGQSIMTPGESERAARAKRALSGVPLPDETWASIVKAARSVGVNRNLAF